MGGKFIKIIIYFFFSILKISICFIQVQVDAPEDTAMYIHRVGRTARYTAGGRGLLMLLPSEEKVVIDELNHVK